MSITKLQKSENNCTYIANGTESVVIKGFMNEPTKPNFYKCDGKSVTVLCRDGETQMCFAIDVVYQYDMESFKRLHEAFNSNDTEALEQEWQKAKPITVT